MDLTPLTLSLVRNGIKNANLSMFSTEQQQIIYTQAGEELLRLHKFDEALYALEKGGKLPIDQLRKIAQSHMDLREYRTAYLILQKIGDTAMANFLKENFLTPKL